MEDLYKVLCRRLEELKICEPSEEVIGRIREVNLLLIEVKKKLNKHNSLLELLESLKKETETLEKNSHVLKDFYTGQRSAYEKILNSI